MTCEQCEWWGHAKSIQGTEDGFCHYYPPSNDHMSIVVYPITRKMDWCSKFTAITLAKITDAGSMAQTDGK